MSAEKTQNWRAITVTCSITLNHSGTYSNLLHSTCEACIRKVSLVSLAQNENSHCQHVWPRSAKISLLPVFLDLRKINLFYLHDFSNDLANRFIACVTSEFGQSKWSNSGNIQSRETISGAWCSIFNSTPAGFTHVTNVNLWSYSLTWIYPMAHILTMITLQKVLLERFLFKLIWNFIWSVLWLKTTSSWFNAEKAVS